MSASPLLFPDLVDVLTEFVGVWINQLLFQHGIYPKGKKWNLSAEVFSKKVCLSMDVKITTFPELQDYIQQVQGAVKELLKRNEIEAVVVELSNSSYSFRFDSFIPADALSDDVLCSMDLQELFFHLRIVLRHLQIDTEPSEYFLIYLKTQSDPGTEWKPSLSRPPSSLSPLYAFDSGIYNIQFLKFER